MKYCSVTTSTAVSGTGLVSKISCCTSADSHISYYYCFLIVAVFLFPIVSLVVAVNLTTTVFLVLKLCCIAVYLTTPVFRKTAISGLGFSD